MTQSNANAFLEKEGIGKLMRKFAIPCVMSLLVAAMAAINNMIHRYGAQAPVFGQPEYAQISMAVAGIAMKVFQIVISVVVGLALLLPAFWGWTGCSAPCPRQISSPSWPW